MVRHTARCPPSPVPGRSGCVCLLAVLSHAAVSVTTPTPPRPAFSSVLYTPRGRTAGSRGFRFGGAPSHLHGGRSLSRSHRRTGSRFLHFLAGSLSLMAMK